MFRSILLFGLILLMSGGATAGIIKVPENYATIQAGINAAFPGDTVLVAAGTYYENIDFKGKAITVASHFLIDGDTTHVNSTIIDGSKPSDPDKGSVVSFVSGEDTTSVLCGFTITGGTGTPSADSRVGGGVYCYSSGARIVHNKIISNSVTHTNARGGGIGTFPFGNNNYSIIEDNVIAGNSCFGVQRGQGGGIYMPQGKINHNIIHDNLCQAGQNGVALGGGIHGACDQSVQRKLHITDNQIEYNRCMNSEFSGRGGGVDTWGGVVVYLTNNVIKYNQVIVFYSGMGGGVDLIGSKEPSVIQNNDISFNSASYGGGVVAYESTGILIEGNEFVNNRADTSGGAGYFQLSNLILKENIFRENQAQYGAGIFGYSGKYQITNNSLTNNEAIYVGGGLEIIGSECTISANRIQGNRASDYNGGGLYLSRSTSEVVNNIISGNKAGAHGGGIYLYGDGSRAQIINNTIVADTAGLYGGGICTDAVSPFIMNSILWDNVAPNGSQIYTFDAEARVVYSDVQGGFDGINIYDFDPGLEADSLSNGNPCLGKGIDVYDFGNGMVCACPATDINGKPRPRPADSYPDLGAWESDLATDVTADIGRNMPLEFILYQNYPNPFNPTTTIEFQIPTSELVTLKIYSLLGQEIATLVDDKRLAPGTYKYQWDARDIASGLYFFKLETGSFTMSRKMLLIR